MGGVVVVVVVGVVVVVVDEVVGVVVVELLVVLLEVGRLVVVEVVVVAAAQSVAAFSPTATTPCSRLSLRAPLTLDGSAATRTFRRAASEAVAGQSPALTAELILSSD